MNENKTDYEIDGIIDHILDNAPVVACPYCGETFGATSGETDYDCDRCEKTFSVKMLYSGSRYGKHGKWIFKAFK